MEMDKSWQYSEVRRIFGFGFPSLHPLSLWLEYNTKSRSVVTICPGLPCYSLYMALTMSCPCTFRNQYIPIELLSIPLMVSIGYLGYLYAICTRESLEGAVGDILDRAGGGLTLKFGLWQSQRFS